MVRIVSVQKSVGTVCDSESKFSQNFLSCAQLVCSDSSQFADTGFPLEFLASHWHGCMAAWLHGCMAVWMHGCMDAWMHAWGFPLECLRLFWQVTGMHACIHAYIRCGNLQSMVSPRMLMLSVFSTPVMNTCQVSSISSSPCHALTEQANRMTFFCYGNKQGV